MPPHNLPCALATGRLSGAMALGRLVSSLALALLTWLLTEVQPLLAMPRVLVSADPVFGWSFGLADRRPDCPAGFAGSCLDFARLPSLSSPFAIIAISNAPRVMPFLFQARPRAMPLETG